LHRKRRESKEVKNSRDKKIMLVKLIIQKKKKPHKKPKKTQKNPPGTGTTKSSVFW
jgi:hypothetical protein